MNSQIGLIYLLYQIQYPLFSTVGPVLKEKNTIIRFFKVILVYNEQRYLCRKAKAFTFFVNEYIEFKKIECVYALLDTHSLQSSA